MISNWKDISSDRAERFLEYADAYLVASVRACWELGHDKERQTWAHASVVQFLAVHSVELFLKGALVRKKVVVPPDHNLRGLLRRYEEANPEAENKFNCPFITQFEGFSKRAMETSPAWRVEPSMECRYPEDLNQNAWPALSSLTASGFGHVLHDLDAQYGRLMPLFGHTRIGKPLYE